MQARSVSISLIVAMPASMSRCLASRDAVLVRGRSSLGIQCFHRNTTAVQSHYDSLEDEETIKAFAGELEKMAAVYSDKRQKHLLEAKANAEFFLQSGFDRLLEGFQEEFGDSLDK